jgi:hypothetical protein
MQTVWRSEHGTIELEEVNPRIVRFRVVGHMSPDAVDAIEAALAPRFAKQRLCVFYDGELMETYDQPFRVRMVEFHRRHKTQISILAVLVRSKLVQMGVSVANLLLGGWIISYTKRNEFEAAITTAKQEHAS